MDLNPFEERQLEALRRGAPDRSPARAGPSALDVWLVEVTYEVVAAESACVACGARLGRGLRVEPTAMRAPATWAATVGTACTSWRRHRHRATVVRQPDGIALGTFTRAGGRRDEVPPEGTS